MNPQDRPAPLWPWVVVSLTLLVAGLYLLRPDPVPPPQARATRAPSSSPTPEKSEVDLGPEDGVARLAFVDSADSSFAKAANELSKRLAQTTQGRVKIKGYPLGQIGGSTLDELQILNAMQKGQLSLAIITCAPLTNLSPRLEVMDLPFLFKDYAHADRVMLGDIGKNMLATLNGSGLIGLGSQIGRAHV